MANSSSSNMSLLGHLKELRRRLIIIIVSLLVATCVVYILSPQLIEFLVIPIKEFFSDIGMVVLTPLGGFSLRFKVSFFAAIVVCSPIWIWQFLAFFLPALKPNERKWILPTFFIGVFLFAFGAVFCYLVILDPAFQWMTEQSAGFASVVPDAAEYLNLILMLEVAFGLAFELPMVIFYLIVFRIVPYSRLRKSWRVVYIVLMLVCALVTPDASPVTMLLMFAAIAALYEISLALSRLVLNKRIKNELETENSNA
jgi:sec-independent protein translocase protein TatC